MLKTIGVEKVEDLFAQIPEAHRFPDLNLPPQQTEMEIAADLAEISGSNGNTKDLLNFIGAGAYDHYTPAAVDNLLQRGEFYETDLRQVALTPPINPRFPRVRSRQFLSTKA